MYATFFFTFITVSLTKVGGESRYTAESSEIGNDLAITGVVLILLAMIRYAAGRLNIIYPEGITLYVMVITLLTETRTALGAGVILVFGFFRTIMTKIKMSRLIIIMASFLILFFVAQRYVGDQAGNTIERIERDQSKDLKLVQNNSLNKILLMLLGSRAIHYVIGFEIMPDNYPLTGIGVENFQEVSGYKNRLHTEYMTQLVENGILGFIIFLVLYVRLFKGLRSASANSRIAALLLWAMYALFFMNLVTWTFNKYWAMIIYALVINEISLSNINIVPSRKKLVKKTKR
jgi:O-antigen ligase